jgi:hypothetical protein
MAAQIEVDDERGRLVIAKGLSRDVQVAPELVTAAAMATARVAVVALLPDDVSEARRILDDAITGVKRLSGAPAELAGQALREVGETL